jgi:hypothetical protein
MVIKYQELNQTCPGEKAALVSEEPEKMCRVSQIPGPES